MADYDKKHSKKDCMCLRCCYGGFKNGKERKVKVNKKAASGLAVIIIVLILFIFLTSTQKVEFNNKQISTASPSGCALFKEMYDPINKICVKSNVQQTNQTS